MFSYISTWIYGDEEKEEVIEKYLHDYDNDSSNEIEYLEYFQDIKDDTVIDVDDVPQLPIEFKYFQDINNTVYSYELDEPVLLYDESEVIQNEKEYLYNFYVEDLDKIKLENELFDIKYKYKNLRARNVISRHCQTVMNSLNEKEIYDLKNIKLDKKDSDLLFNNFFDSKINYYCNGINKKETILDFWKNFLYGYYPEHKKFIQETNFKVYMLEIISQHINYIRNNCLDFYSLRELFMLMRRVMVSHFEIEFYRSLNNFDYEIIDYLISFIIEKFVYMYLDVINFIGAPTKKEDLLLSEWDVKTPIKCFEKDKISLNHFNNAKKNLYNLFNK